MTPTPTHPHPAFHFFLFSFLEFSFAREIWHIGSVLKLSTYKNWILQVKHDKKEMSWSSLFSSVLFSLVFCFVFFHKKWILTVKYSTMKVSWSCPFFSFLFKFYWQELDFASKIWHKGSVLKLSILLSHSFVASLFSYISHRFISTQVPRFSD